MEKTIQQKVGNKIKEYREKRKLTQEELSEKSGIDYKYLQKIERKTPPNLKVETIERIARALNISPSKLLNF